MAVLGVHMTIELEINQGVGWHQVVVVKFSGISLGEKMDNTINVRGVTYMANVHFQIEEFSNATNIQGQGRTIRQMVDQGLNLCIINGSDKKFH